MLFRSATAEWDASYVEFMKKIASMTGGIFEQITSEKEFETKFLKVATRPLLAAGNPDADTEEQKGPICL